MIRKYRWWLVSLVLALGLLAAYMTGALDPIIEALDGA